MRTGSRPPSSLHLRLLQRRGDTSRSTLLLHVLRRFSTARVFLFPCLLRRVPFPSPVELQPVSPPVTTSRSVPHAAPPTSPPDYSRVPESHVAVDPFKVQGKFIALEPTSLPVISGFPPETAQCLVESLNYMMSHSLRHCQHVFMGIESDNWIPGRLDPLRRTLQATKALAKRRPVVDGFLSQADKAVKKGISSCEIFRTLLKEIFSPPHIPASALAKYFSYSRSKRERPMTNSVSSFLSYWMKILRSNTPTRVETYHISRACP